MLDRTRMASDLAQAENNDGAYNRELLTART
jgi:hypothetical protein